MVSRSIPSLPPSFNTKFTQRLKTLLTAGVLALQALACVTASAVELAGISVTSTLNEPLQASISLNGVDPATSPDSLVVSLASADAHEAAGIPVDKAITGLIFIADLVSTPPVVRVESINPVVTPFLRFLVLVESGEQQLLRDYTVMLDPADISTTVQVATAKSGQSRISESTLSYPGEYIGPIKQGETLMQIARRIVVAGPITLEQTMVALVNDNPEDFIDGNMNLLREGATLHVPSERRMADTDPEGASSIYENHLLNWLQRRPQSTSDESSSNNWMTLHSPALEPPDVAVGSADGSSVSYILRIVQPPDESPGQGEVTSGAALVTSDTQKSTQEKSTPAALASDEAVAALTDRLSVVEESLGSKELENQQLNQQVELLQRQLEKTMQLIELQETQLAIAQKQLQTMLAQELSTDQANYGSPSEPSEGGESSADSAALSSAVQVEKGGEIPKGGEEDSAIESGEQTSPAEPVQSPTTDEPMAESVASLSLDAAMGNATEPVGPLPPWIEPAQTLDWVAFHSDYWINTVEDFGPIVLQALVEGESVVPGMAQQTLSLLVVMFLLLWLFILFRRRRVARNVSEGENLLAEDSAVRRPLFDRDATQTQSDSGIGEPATPEESVGAGFVTDIETQRGVAVQSDEVDPLTESEIYLAYGRSTQAEQTLRDAILRTPDRIELKLKLLEVLKVLSRSDAFQELVTDVRDRVVPGSPEEAHLDKLIREFELDAGDGASDAEVIPKPAVIDLPDRPMIDDADTPSSAVPAASSQDDGIAFEIDTDPPPPSVSLAQEAAPAAFGLEQTAIDPAGSLELELEPSLMDVTFTQSETVKAGVLVPDSAAPEGLMATADDAASAVDNEEKTQLELANAYLEMGDPAAAREILTGLSLSQDEAIKERAQALLEEARR